MRAPRIRDVRQTATVVVGRTLLVVVVVGCWQWLSQSGWVSPLLLPAPLDVVRRLSELLATAEPWHALFVTVVDVVLAFVFSVVLGIAFGVAVGSSRYWSQVTEPLLVALYTIPIIVIYPVLTLMFGIGDVSKVVFGGIYGFFPIAANALRGIQLVSPAYLEAARSLGASRRQLRWTVLVPAARPFIMAGVRIGLSLNLIAVVAGQMLASADGIGFLISTNAQLLNASDLYAYILLTFVLAAAINYVLTRNEQYDPARQARSKRATQARRAPALVGSERG
ncbi:MAG: ABC transporter permease subunit [Propionibacteriales bacterium]|nr:ABC transporter permease subunit [Propionibacteriales bacterium]